MLLISNLHRVGSIQIRYSFDMAVRLLCIVLTCWIYVEFKQKNKALESYLYTHYTIFNQSMRWTLTFFSKSIKSVASGKHWWFRKVFQVIYLHMKPKHLQGFLRASDFFLYSVIPNTAW